MNRTEIFHIDEGKKNKALVLITTSSREKILQYKSQGDIKIRETIERENKVGGGRRNKSQDKETLHKSIWKVPAQVSLHRMVDWGIELKFAKVNRNKKREFLCDQEPSLFNFFKHLQQGFCCSKFSVYPE